MKQQVGPQLELAARHIERGDLEGAHRVCCEVLQRDLNNAEALHLLGVIALRNGNADLAISALSKAIEKRPMVLQPYIDLALSYCRRGQSANEIGVYEQALTYHPHEACLYCGLARACRTLGDYDEAFRHYNQALAISPWYEDGYLQLAELFLSSGRIGNAVTCCRTALRLNGKACRAYLMLSRAMEVSGQHEESLRMCEQALESDPLCTEAYCHMGRLAAQLGRLEQAVAYFRSAIAHDSGCEEAHRECIKAQEALKLTTEGVDSITRLGKILFDRGRYEEAGMYFADAALRTPTNCDALFMLGVTQSRIGQPEHGVATLRQAIALRPSHAEAHYFLAELLLRLGEFEEGWREFEWRLRAIEPESRARDYAQPLWDGSQFAGKTILLHTEQGMGDTIQFIRFAKLVKHRGGTVVLRCQRRLVPLLKMVADLDFVTDDDRSVPPFDCHAPLLSLPRIFRTVLSNIPAQIPYIDPPLELVSQWGRRIGQSKKFKIGLVWAGRTQNQNDCTRSMSLMQFRILANIGDVQWFSLQRGTQAAQILTPPSGLEIRPIEKTGNDIVDTAAIIMNLDLVISVDTMVAHLAGALGRTVWTLIPFSWEWRYLTDRTDTPWYPTMRLFRQPRRGDWDSVLEEVHDALLETVASSVLTNPV